MMAKRLGSPTAPPSADGEQPPPTSTGVGVPAGFVVDRGTGVAVGAGIVGVGGAGVAVGTGIVRAGGTGVAVGARIAGVGGAGVAVGTGIVGAGGTGVNVGAGIVGRGGASVGTAGFTVTVKFADPSCPAASIAVHMTVVSPKGNVKPEVGMQVAGTAPSTLSVALEENVWIAPLGPVATSVTGGGTVTVGGAASEISGLILRMRLFPRSAT